MSVKHPNSRPVTIFRAGSFINDAQTNAQEFMAMSKKSIGSYFASKNSKAIGSGLSFAEQALLLPYILDTPAEDRQFREKVKKFYSELITPVPYGKGVTLETGLETDNNAPVSAANMPIELMDYIRWRHAVTHPEVAGSLSEAQGNQLKKYYIFDKTAVEDNNAKLVLAQDDAMVKYLALKDNSDKVNMLLTLMGTDPRTFKGKNAAIQRREALRTIVSTKPVEFLKELNDKQFEFKYLLKAMENCNVIRRVGEQFVDNETGSILGHNLDEAIYFLQDKTKSQEIAMLKSRLQEGLKDLAASKQSVKLPEVTPPVTMTPVSEVTEVTEAVDAGEKEEENS